MFEITEAIDGDALPIWGDALAIDGDALPM
jgi:hypothetical protein